MISLLRLVDSIILVSNKLQYTIMVRKILKKYRNNKNKIKPKGRKRKIFATIVLALSLLFGKSRLSSSHSPSSNFDNQTIQERVIND